MMAPGFAQALTAEAAIATWPVQGPKLGIDTG
jgi:hypothetical protein